MVPEESIGMSRDETEEVRHLYMKVYEYMKDLIISGAYAYGEKIPSKRALASLLHCSLNTVQSAYGQLVDEGYLIAQEKRGYYVADLEGIAAGMRQVEPIEVSQRQAVPFRYNFSYQGIDLSAFPITVWRRLTREVLSDETLRFLESGNPKGEWDLRVSIATYLRLSRGVQCTPNQILIGSGTEYLLQLLIQLFDAETVYAIEDPGYEKLALMFNRARVSFRPISVDESGLVPQSLAESDADVVCITPSHQFPTGSIMPVGRRVQLLSWAQEKEGRYIIEDDYDSEFRFAGKPIPSLQGLDQSGRVIYLGSFSKSLFPSLRISYLVLPDQLASRYDEVLNFTVCPVPLTEQLTLAHFLSRGHFDRHLNRMRKLYRGKRDTLVAALKASFPDIRIEGASGGGHLLVHLDSQVPEEILVRRAAEAGVKVYALSRFFCGRTQKPRRSTLLLGYASLSLQEIQEAVELLTGAWNVL